MRRKNEEEGFSKNPWNQVKTWTVLIAELINKSFCTSWKQETPNSKVMSSGDLIILKQTVHHFLASILLSGNKVFSLLGITNKENLKGWIRNNFLRFGFLIFFFILVIITFNTQIKLVLISLIFDISIQNILINQQENRVIFAIFSNTKDYVNLKLVHETKKK